MSNSASWRCYLKSFRCNFRCLVLYTEMTQLKEEAGGTWLWQQVAPSSSLSIIIISREGPWSSCQDHQAFRGMAEYSAGVSVLLQEPNAVCTLAQLVHQ